MLPSPSGIIKKLELTAFSTLVNRKVRSTCRVTKPWAAIIGQMGGCVPPKILHGEGCKGKRPPQQLLPVLLDFSIFPVIRHFLAHSKMLTLVKN